MINSKTKIIAEGFYLPEKIITNEELCKSIDSNHEWILSRTGIISRHIAADLEFTSDLAANAMHDLFQNYAIDPSSIDGIIIATTTPDQIFPSTASIIQNKLGLKNLGFCFDISAVCAGFVYALAIADSLIKSGAAKRIAVIGAETMSRIIDWHDRSTCILFGDGAAAMLLETCDDDSGIIGYNLFSDGNMREILEVKGGISCGKADAKIFMNGKEVFKNAVEKMASSCNELLHKFKIDKNDISWVLPHQANQRILTSIASKLDISFSKVISTISTHANTSAASIPLAYSKFYRNKSILKSDLILLTALGAGLSWGSMLIKI